MLYIKPIKKGKFYLIILYLQLAKNRKILYTMKSALQKYNTSSSQLPAIKSFNKKMDLLRKQQHQQKVKDAIKISVIHITSMYP